MKKKGAVDMNDSSFILILLCLLYNYTGPAMFILNGAVLDAPQRVVKFARDGARLRAEVIALASVQVVDI